MKKIKPMLASAVTDINNLRFPLLASPKLDGIRAVIINGVVMSRSLKPIPNAHVQALFGRHEYGGLDGELIVGDPYSPTVFRDTTSAVMSRDGEPDVMFHIFDDMTNPQLPFVQRYTQAYPQVYSRDCDKQMRVVKQHYIQNTSDLERLESAWLAAGYEGIMLRDPKGPYKFGRSTLKEGYLLKLKRFCDSEAEIIGFAEQMHNGNEATRDALGNVERSACKSGLSGKGTLGALQVKDINTGVEFDIGTGLDDATRVEIWANMDRYRGQLVRYKYFPSGSKDKPRFPVFQGFRDARDL